jgi:hypothetical protein
MLHDIPTRKKNKLYEEVYQLDVPQQFLEEYLWVILGLNNWRCIRLITACACASSEKFAEVKS